MHLGAGRFTKGDAIDHSTGLILYAKVGDYIEAGEPLVEIHARSEADIAAIRDALTFRLHVERGARRTPTADLRYGSPIIR